MTQLHFLSDAQCEIPATIQHISSQQYHERDQKEMEKLSFL